MDANFPSNGVTLMSRKVILGINFNATKFKYRPQTKSDVAVRIDRIQILGVGGETV